MLDGWEVILLSTFFKYKVKAPFPYRELQNPFYVCVRCNGLVAKVLE